MATHGGVGLGNDIKGLKPGKARTSKRRKGNAPARTTKRGNGKKIR